MCQLARSAGATVIGLVSTPPKAEIARANGATHTLNYTTGDFVAEVAQITGGRGVHVVYDGVGKQMYRALLSCLGKRGAYVSFGNAGGRIESIDPADLTAKCVAFMRPAMPVYVETREEFQSRRPAGSALIA